MPDRSFLDWPFLGGEHRALADRADAWARDVGAGDGGAKRITREAAMAKVVATEVRKLIIARQLLSQPA